MIFPQYFWIILTVSALGCCIGFKNFIWFLSVGYGLSVSLIAVSIAVLAIAGGSASLPFLLLCCVLFAYGLRLGLFLLIRELKNKNYRKTLKEATGGTEKKMPYPVLIIMWLMVAFLYYMQTSGLFYRYANGASGKTDACIIIGLLISLAGFIVEAAADAQKTAQKKENPKMVATKGLYRLCRCPNYFGEILVWTGVFVSGIPVYQGGQWVIAILGYILIVYIMFNGAKRLETRQTKRCWKMKEYRDYVDKTPIIIPFLPVYHLIDWVH